LEKIGAMTRVALAAFVVLFVLHHDFWYWGEERIVFEFLPIGLAYHAAFSVATAAFWLFVVRCVWPSDIEQWAEGDGEVAVPPAAEMEGGS